METILVTGATGNVGSHVVHELRARAASVRALVATPARSLPRSVTPSWPWATSTIATPCDAPWRA